MACHCLLQYSPLSSSFLQLPNPKLKTLIKRSKKPTLRAITSQFQTPGLDNDDKEKKRNTPFDFLRLSVTLTVISSSLPQTAALAAATVKEKKRAPKKPTTKKVEALSPEELKSWTQGLPLVSDRIPYTEILELKKDGKLKHIIKTSAVNLRQRAVPVLVVLDDSRVLRTVLPSFESHRKFWESWDELKIDSVCVNAYSPPLKRPDLPSPILRLWVPPMVESFLSSLLDGKPKKESKKAAELRQVRMELQRQKKEELKKVREEREMMEKSIKMQKKEEERKRKKEIRKRRYEESLRVARTKYLRTADFWSDLARDQNVTSALGLVFFYIFYRTVVLSYRKQKKDYEDRLKIEKAEAEERKKMRELEREMNGLEGDDDESEPGKEEENAYLKMAKQFMKSGARVRRAQNKKLPQYLERGVDVKFSDVAGLGKIRLELEEIVKFFTHGEMYRRRGVKIPGHIFLNSAKHLIVNLNSLRENLFDKFKRIASLVCLHCSHEEKSFR